MDKDIKDKKPEEVRPDVTQTTPEMPEPVIVTPAEPMSPMSADPSMPIDDGMAGYTETKSNKLVYVLVFVLVVILLSLVGLFLYKQFVATTAPAAEVMMDEPIAEEMISPTVVISSDPEVAALEELDIPNLDTELENIDKDLGQL